MHQYNANHEKSAVQENSGKNAKLVSPSGQHDFTCGDMWLALPDRILAQVFTHLSLKDRLRLQRVNRQWQRCALMTMCKLKVEFVDYFGVEKTMQLQDGVCSKTKAASLEKCPVLLDRFSQSTFGSLFLNLRKAYLPEEVWDPLSKMAERAKALHVAFTIFGNPVEFGKLCDRIGPRVTHLRFHPFVHSESIDEYVASFSKLKRLKYFRWSECAMLFPAMIQHSKDAFCNLEEIDFTECRHPQCSTDAHDLNSLFVATFKQKIKKVAIVRHDIIRWSDITIPPKLILMDMMKHFVNLEELSIEYSVDYLSGLAQLVSCLQEISVSCCWLRSFHLKLNMMYDTSISMELVLGDVENTIEAIGHCKKLDSISVHFDILHSSDPYYFFFKDTLPFKKSLNIPLLCQLQNGATIKKFVGSSYIASEQLVSWNPWGSLSKALPNVEEVTIHCWPRDLEHFNNLQSLKHIVICNPDCRNLLWLSEIEIAYLIKSCPSLVSVAIKVKVKPGKALFKAVVKAAKRQKLIHQDFTTSLLKSFSTESWRQKYTQVAPRNLCIHLVHCTEYALQTQ